MPVLYNADAAVARFPPRPTPHTPPPDHYNACHYCYTVAMPPLRYRDHRLQYLRTADVNGVPYCVATTPATYLPYHSAGFLPVPHTFTDYH